MADKKTLGETIGYPGSNPKKDDEEETGMWAAIKRKAKSALGGSDTSQKVQAQPSARPSKRPGE
jgi:hypothetical protein